MKIEAMGPPSVNLGGAGWEDSWVALWGRAEHVLERPGRSDHRAPRRGPRRPPEFLLLSLSPCWLRLDRYRLILFSRGKPLGHREVQ